MVFFEEVLLTIDKTIEKGEKFKKTSMKQLKNEKNLRRQA